MGGRLFCLTALTTTMEMPTFSLDAFSNLAFAGEHLGWKFGYLQS